MEPRSEGASGVSLDYKVLMMTESSALTPSWQHHILRQYVGVSLYPSSKLKGTEGGNLLLWLWEWKQTFQNMKDMPSVLINPSFLMGVVSAWAWGFRIHNRGPESENRGHGGWKEKFTKQAGCTEKKLRYFRNTKIQECLLLFLSPHLH